ncbi:MAG: peptidase C26, partial [Tepidanaerobacter acetatoxydans]|nr:peptidase C26 [Tepidanaerobacter acetatoxydans]
MLPLIGITMSFDYDKNQAQLGEKYFHAVQLAGGLPVAIPPIQDET